MGHLFGIILYPHSHFFLRLHPALSFDNGDNFGNVKFFRARGNKSADFLLLYQRNLWGHTHNATCNDIPL